MTVVIGQRAGRAGQTTPVAVAVRREVLEDIEGECVILRGSRGWGEQSDINVIVVHGAVAEKPGASRLVAAVVQTKNRHDLDSPDYQADLERSAGPPRASDGVLSPVVQTWRPRFAQPVF